MHSPRDSEITGQVPTAVDRTDVDPESVRLWDALARARADDDPGALAAAEDGVFRFYLPLAHAILYRSRCVVVALSCADGRCGGRPRVLCGCANAGGGARRAA